MQIRFVDAPDYNSIFFTSDHHFGHANIIKYCKRPFTSVEAMDEALIALWNDIVPEQAMVFHLGDFTLGEDADKYFAQLNGKIYFLATSWHHDKRWLPNLNWIQDMPMNRFTKTKTRTVSLYPETLLVSYGPDFMQKGVSAQDARNDQHIHLSHYPLAEWERKHHGAWHLHGHSHGNYASANKSDLILDVGVDNVGYAPISLRRIHDIMYEKKRKGDN
jgi:calcineurin-like phosphoesterase family protein